MEENMHTFPKARQSGIVVQEMPEEVLIYDLSTNKAHCLNKSAALIWRSCNGNRSTADIVHEFERSGAGNVSEDFVWLAIDQLQEKDLLENVSAPRFTGQSRRQVLKTIGLASLVAVPVVASLVAPPSALAATSCSGCTANTPNDVLCIPKAATCGPNCNALAVCAP
jgi:hypothetical protein